MHFKIIRHPYFSRSPNAFKLDERYNKMRITYRPLIALVDGLAVINFITQYKGYYNRETRLGKLTRLVASPLIQSLIKNHKLTMHHVIEMPTELIRLKKNSKYVNYKDTKAIIKLRSRLEKHNKVLLQSNIELRIPKKKKDTNASFIKSLDSLIFSLSPKMIHPL